MDNKEIFSLILIGLSAILIYKAFKSNYRYRNHDIELDSDYTPASTKDPRNYYKQESFVNGASSIGMTQF